MEIVIEHNSKVPKHTQLFNQIRDLVKKNKWPQGYKLPSENQFQDELGVSRSTVRQALQAAMNEGLIEKIMGKGSFVSYRDKRASNLLGVIAADFQSPYHQHILRGVEAEARKAGYNIIFGNSHNDFQEEKNILHQFREHKVTGILLWPAIHDIYDPEMLVNMRQEGIPVVLLDRSIPGVSFDTVLSDNFTGAYKAVEYFIRMKFSDIYFISRPILSINSISERYAGYRQAMNDHGCLCHDPILVGEQNRELSLKEYPLREGDEEFKNLVHFLQETPREKAVLAMNDIMALNLMEIARGEGISIPGELSVIGFDNREVGASYRVPLTTIRQDPYSIGLEATRLMLARIQDNSRSYQTVKVPVDMIIRDSVKTIRQI